jgi:alpha-tubulin suppressor-like RCC1 family protein
MFKALPSGVAALVALGLLGPASAAPLPDSPGVAWGAGSNGRLGTGTTSDALSPMAVQGPTFNAITAGSYHSCGISAGTAYCWGEGANGRLGTGTYTDQLLPTLVQISGPVFSSITAGSRHTCALDTTGQAYCWGEGGSGRLGTGATKDSVIPVPVDTSGALAGKTLAAITAGWDYTCALDTAGQAYCWGYGGAGQLGNGTLGNKYSPTPVASGTWTAVDAGVNHTCAISTDGTAWCWGEGSVGQLGTGSSSPSPVPLAVDSTATWSTISAGDQFTCALTSAATPFCWGEGESGRLGNDSISRRKSPDPVMTSGVLAGRTLTRVTAGTSHACALDTEGLAYCWGNGFAGRLGTGNVTSVRVPAAVDTAGTLLGRRLTTIVAGTSDTLALVEGGPLPTAPSAPTAVQARAGNRQASVTWTPGADGGAPVTSFTVTSKPGNHVCSAAAPPCIVTGLGNNRAYAFVVTATNRIGTSAQSALSPTVTPVAPTPTPSRPKLTFVKIKVGRHHARLRYKSEPAKAKAQYRMMTRKGTFPKWRKLHASPWRFKVAAKRRYVLKLRVTNAAGHSPVRVLKFRVR